MLGNPTPFAPTAFDLDAFEIFVPQDHHLRKALQVINWEAFHDILAPYYSPNLGQPSEPPVLMLKLEYLRYHYNLSDRQVIARSQTDLAFRMFLQVDYHDTLVHPTSLCHFRGRLKADGFRSIFQQVVSQARDHGLVKDRLRLKDATHVLADIQVPSTLTLVAQIRDRLLDAAEPFAATRVEGERVNVELLRERTQTQQLELRLQTRVLHLQDILAWVDELPAPEDADTNSAWKKLREQRELAHQILYDREHPEAGDQVRSTTDPEARRNKHGDWFDGYKFDVLIDADSELITEVDVLPANGDEAANAPKLIEREESAHGNQVEAASIDGAGYNGPMLRELEDPEGLNVDTYVPVPQAAAGDRFTPDDFTEDKAAGTVSCPAAETSSYRQRDSGARSTTYRFKGATCAACPLVGKCMKKPPRGAMGRSVRKNDYEPEYRRAREKTQTEAYAETRRQHPKVERKLGEVMNRHGGRRARYRGRAKVLVQELMACTATNIKRMIRLLCEVAAAPKLAN